MSRPRTQALRHRAQVPKCALFTLLILGSATLTEASPSGSEGVIRSRDLRARAAAIPEHARPGAKLRLSLFSDADYSALLDRSEARADGSRVWIGHVSGDAESSVVLVKRAGVLAGRVVVGSRVFRIRYVGSGNHRIEELDLDQAPPMDPGAPRPYLPPIGEIDSSRWRTQAARIPRPRSEAAILDLLAVATPAAQRRVGGAKAMRSLVSLQVEVANQALANSGAKLRYRLVKTKRMAYSEADSMAQDLTHLAYGGDGELEGVHGLRTRMGADFVVLYVDRPRDAYCGRAYLGWSFRMLEHGSNPADAAFSVVRIGCPDLTLAHELGHNLGLLHAREDYSEPHLVDASGAFVYSYGFKNLAEENRFHTVMAYRCRRCQPILHYSNPRVGYGGDRTGVGRKKDLSADVVRSMNRIRDEVAAHRECRVSCDEP